MLARPEAGAREPLAASYRPREQEREHEQERGRWNVRPRRLRPHEQERPHSNLDRAGAATYLRSHALREPEADDREARRKRAAKLLHPRPQEHDGGHRSQRDRQLPRLYAHGAIPLGSPSGEPASVTYTP